MNPTEIARQTMKALVAERLPPTPEQYSKVYYRLIGATQTEPARDLILEMAGVLGQGMSADRDLQKLDEALTQGDWETAHIGAKKLIERTRETQSIDWAELLRDTLREWDVAREGITKAKKREALDHLMGAGAMDRVKLAKRLRALIQSWRGQGTEADATSEAETTKDGSTDEVPASAMSANGVPANSAPATARLQQPAESHNLSNEANTQVVPHTASALPASADALVSPSTAIKTTMTVPVVDSAPALRRLWQLLMENLADLVEDDSWVRGQVQRMRELFDQELTEGVLLEAEQSFKAMVIRQSGAKAALDDAKFALKEMVSVLINRLGVAVEDTDVYSNQLQGYAVQVEQAEDITQLSNVVQRMLGDTQTIQVGLTRSRDELREARANVEHHQQQVHHLRSELAQVSASVRIDELTQTLNRRGLDHAFQTELARCKRSNSPLCVALLDLDNFKQLNDRLGHQAGDEVLRFLVASIKTGLRPTDVIARWGGEEFVLLLPHSDIEEAINVMTRLQRSLTSQLFMYHQERIFVTFSAGVALWNEGESQDEIVARADAAMFKAKKSGKNRVCSA